MKIKIRPDDAGPPGGSEWAEMNGWLAKLRDDSEGGPGGDGQVGEAGGSQVSGGRDGYAGSSGHRDTAPARDRFAAPAMDRDAAPTRDREALPPGDRFAAPAMDREAAPPGDRFAAPARDDYVAPARDYSVAPARDRFAAPPRHRAAPPPPGAPVRAVIGDELRMPILWCEMSSCISWHADPAALGEADNRARAIHAGWRIDALGRLTCPQCQQTAVAFRATRPVVLWDRATAITMAARATAVPGYHAAGPASGAYGRGARRPAAGHR